MRHIQWSTGCGTFGGPPRAHFPMHEDVTSGGPLVGNQWTTGCEGRLCNASHVRVICASRCLYAKLGPKNRQRDVFCVQHKKTKNKTKQKANKKTKAKMKLLTARPCFLFTVLLSTEDSSAVKMEKGNQNYAKLAFRSKNKIEYVRKMENMG